MERAPVGKILEEDEGESERSETFKGIHSSLKSLLVLGDLGDGVGEVLDSGRGDTSHGNATVASHVDVVLGGKFVALLRSKSRVAEHTNLLSDVRPIASGAGSLEVLNEELAHLDDTIRHNLNVLAPLRSEIRVSQDGGDETSTRDGRVGVVRTDEDLELRIDASRLSGTISENVDGTNALTIETKVLGEGLGDQGAVALGNEVANGPDIALRVARGKSLVGHIEEDEVSLLLTDLRDLLPLLLGGINSSGVVSADVEQEDRASRSVINIRQHTVLIQTNGVGIVVTVRLNVKASILSDGDVITPGRIGQVDILVLGQEAAQKVRTDTKRTSSRESLSSHDLLRLEDVRTSAEDQLLRGRVEIREARNTYSVEYKIQRYTMRSEHMNSNKRCVMLVNVHL